MKLNLVFEKVDGVHFFGPLTAMQQWIPSGEHLPVHVKAPARFQMKSSFTSILTFSAGTTGESDVMIDDGWV